MSKTRHVELTVVCHAYTLRPDSAFAHLEIRDSRAAARRFTGVRQLGDAFLFAYAFKTHLEADSRGKGEHVEVTIRLDGPSWDYPHYRKGAATADSYGKLGKGFLLSGS